MYLYCLHSEETEFLFYRLVSVRQLLNFFGLISSDVKKGRVVVTLQVLVLAQLTVEIPRLAPVKLKNSVFRVLTLKLFAIFIVLHPSYSFYFYPQVNNEAILKSYREHI